MTSDFDLDLMASALVQRLLRIQYLEDLEFADDLPPRRRAEQRLSLRWRYKDIGLIDLSQPNIREVD